VLVPPASAPRGASREERATLTHFFFRFDDQLPPPSAPRQSRASSLGAEGELGGRSERRSTQFFFRNDDQVPPPSPSRQTSVSSLGIEGELAGWSERRSTQFIFRFDDQVPPPLGTEAGKSELPRRRGGASREEHSTLVAFV
jgi:hypothetical protein